MSIAVRRRIDRQGYWRSALRRRAARRARSLPLRAGPLTAFVLSLLIAVPGPPAQGAAAEHGANTTEVAQLDSDRQAGPPRVLQTRHDLSPEGVGPCLYCHLTREADNGVKPQWDRRQDAAMYPAYGAAGGPPTTKWRPQGVSQVCLSCHDGTIGPDRMVQSIVGTTGWDPVRNPQRGTVYLSDHPVSAAFKGGEDGGFNAASGGYAGALPFFGDRKDRVECASCHNVHYETYGAFLRLAAAQGRLCRSCHIK
jgi:predicted CXXCH cytochrome family protein